MLMGYKWENNWKMSYIKTFTSYNGKIIFKMLCIEMLIYIHYNNKKKRFSIKKGSIFWWKYICLTMQYIFVKLNEKSRWLVSLCVQTIKYKGTLNKCVTVWIAKISVYKYVPSHHSPFKCILNKKNLTWPKKIWTSIDCWR